MAQHDIRQLALRELGTHPHNALHIGAMPAVEIAERFGTPLYVFDAGILRQRLARVQQAMGPQVDVFFAVKANPNVAVTEVLHRAGAGAEVASAGEIQVALAAGVAGPRMQFAGPGKSRADLTAAMSVELGLINLESAAEYATLARLASEQGRRPRVQIRVNPEQEVSGSRMRMGGGSQRFGVDSQDVVGLAMQILRDDVVELCGLHVYAGTQCFDASAWLNNAERLLDLANALEGATGKQLTTLNFGGGFAVPSFAGDKIFDLAKAGEGLQELIARDARRERQYAIELGRYLTAPAGIYLTRVRYLKDSGGKHHAVLDGGMHHHGAAAGLGAVIKRAFPLVLARDLGGAGGTGDPRAAADERDAAATEPVVFTLGGPLCTPADEIGHDIELPDLEPGDVLAVLVSGAYGLTFSNTMFLSHPTPAEVLVDNGECTLVRERGKPEDALRYQVLPEQKR